MPLYKIADFFVKMQPKYDFSKNLAQDYYLKDFNENDSADIELNISENTLESFNEKFSGGIDYAENRLLSDMFAFKIARRSALCLHASAIKYSGKAFCFLAHSGEGKSTHAKHWQKAFGEEKVKILNDDFPVLRCFEDEIFIYGSPFCGGSTINVNEKAPLGAMIFLKKAEENKIEKLNLSNYVPRLMDVIIHNIDQETMRQVLDTVEQIVEKVPGYLLHCTNDVASAEFAENIL